MCERVWRIAQDCAKKQELVARSRGWLAACEPPECCTRAKHAKSWRVAPAIALQDKSTRLARPFARGLNSRLNPIMMSSRQNTLFGKNWLFTFLLTLLYIYIYPYTHDFERAFQREFWERNPRKNQDWLFHNLYLRDSSNSSTLFFSIVKSLRGLLPKPFLTISISVRGLFDALGSS